MTYMVTRDVNFTKKDTSDKVLDGSEYSKYTTTELYGSSYRVENNDVTLTGFKINAGAGNNTIKGTKYSDKITALSGNDTAYSSTGNDVYSLGGGENTIIYVGAFNTDTINLTKNESLTLDLSSYSNISGVSDLKIAQIGKDISITVPSADGEYGEIILKNYAKNQLSKFTFKFSSTSWVSNSYTDFVSNLTLSYDNSNFNKKGSLTTTKYNDNVNVTDLGKNLKLNVGAGNNEVYVENDYKNTITSGDGDDKITVVGGQNTVKAGNGTNTITAVGGTNTLTTGAHNDTFNISGNGKYTINAGAGSNYIKIDNSSSYGEIILNEQKVNALQYLQFTNELENYSCEQVGKDLVITESKGTITVKNYYAKVKNQQIVNISINNTQSIALADFVAKQQNVGAGTLYTISEDTTIDSLKSSDVLKFANSNLTYKRQTNSSDLIIVDNSNQNTVTIKNYFEGNTENTLGQLLNNSDLAYIGASIRKTVTGKGDDIIYETNSKGIVKAGAGNDEITVMGDYNNIYGEAGNDKIDIRGVENIVYGGKGNDAIYINNINLENKTDKSYSNYNYLNFKNGDGYDTIYGINECSGALFLTFEDVEFKDLKLVKYDGDLIIFYNNQKDSVTLKDYYYSDADDFELKIDKDFDIKIACKTEVEDLSNLTSDANVIEISSTIPREISNAYSATSSSDIININHKNMTVDAGNGDDYITVTNDRNSVSGGNGNDYISVYGKNNVIYGNKGNDYIVADESAFNQYVFSAGDGNDTLSISSGILEFEDSNLSDLNFVLYGGDIIIKYNNADSVTLSGGCIFEEDEKSFDIIDCIVVCKDGELKLSEILDKNGYVTTNHEKSLTVYGTDNVDYIDVYSNDTIYAGKGNDKIVISGDNNTVYAEDGSDEITIYGGENNTIYGGKGDDVFHTEEDGSSANTFAFKNGDGDDRIFADSNITLQFDDSKEGDLTYSKYGSDLVIKYNKGKDSVTIDGYYKNENLSDIKVLCKDTTEGYTVIVGNTLSTLENEISKGVTLELASTDSEVSIDYDNTRVYSENGNELTINVKSNNNSITTGSGNDTFDVSGNNNTVTSYGGRNTITLSGVNNTVFVDSGDCTTVEAKSNYNTITLGSANDEVTVSGEKNIVSVGYGDDTITNNGSNNTFVFTGGNDRILRVGVTDTIKLTSSSNNFTYSQAEDDLIIEYSSYNGGESSVTIEDYFSGKDYLDNYLSNMAITGADYVPTGTAYADRWYLTSVDDEILNSGSGDDDLYIRGNRNSISAEDGNDEIDVYGNYNTVDAGSGNDYIYVNGENNTIKAGKGNDRISISNYDEDDENYEYTGYVSGSGNNIIEFSKGDGHDRVFAPEVDTILSFNGVSSTEVTYYNRADKDLIISYNNGNDSVTLENYFDVSDYYSDSDENQGYKSTITLLFRDKTVTVDANKSAYETIGNYFVNNYFTENDDDAYIYINDTNLDLGAGDDEVYVYGDSNTINGGTGNDVINIGEGYNNTVYGGAGNDTICIGYDDGANGMNTCVFHNGDGNDRISIYSSNTTNLQFDSITGMNFEKYGEDLIIHYNNNSDSVTIDEYYEDYSSSNITINGTGLTSLLSSKGVTIANTSANETVTGTINKDTMYITGDNKTVYADAGDDYIWVKGSANTIHAGDGDDEININNSNSVIYGEKGNDYISIGWEYDDSVTNTTCIFNNGDGNDIVDTCNDVTLKFLDSLMSDLTYTQNGDDLIIGYSSKDTVTLRDYFYIESEADDYSTSHNIEIVCKDTVTSHKLVLNGVETTIETQIDINGLQQETASFESQSLSDAIMVADDVPSDSATAVIAQYTPEQPQTM